MFIFSLILTTVSSEFPIAQGAGDQLYPDVCWDGSKFWIVWEEGTDGNIHAATVKEDASVGEALPLYVSNAKKHRPHIAYGNDTFCLAFAQVLDTFSNSPYYIILDADGKPYWKYAKDIGYHATDLSDYGFGVIRCKDHFMLYYTRVEWNQWEGFSWGEAAILNGEGSDVTLMVTLPGLFTYIYDVAWNGERILFSTSRGLIWRFDSLGQNPLPADSDFFMPRVEVSKIERFTSPVAACGERFGMIGSYIPDINNDYFDLLNKQGQPEYENPLEIIPHKGPNFRSYPSVLAYGQDRFIYVSSQATGYHPNYNYTLQGTEIDTNVNLICEGYLTGGPRDERYPAICFGKEHFLLVWCDNRSGDWDIYGRILDSLPYSGVEEPSSPSSYPLPKDVRTMEVDKTCFTDRLGIRLLNGSGEEGIVTIRDVTGRTVRTLEVRVGKNTWDGRDQDGTALNKGVYFVSLERGTGVRPVKVVKLQL